FDLLRIDLYSSAQVSGDGPREPLDACVELEIGALERRRAMREAVEHQRSVEREGFLAHQLQLAVEPSQAHAVRRIGDVHAIEAQSSPGCASAPNEKSIALVRRLSVPRLTRPAACTRASSLASFTATPSRTSSDTDALAVSATPNAASSASSPSPPGMFSVRF